MAQLYPGVDDRDADACAFVAQTFRVDAVNACWKRLQRGLNSLRGGCTSRRLRGRWGRWGWRGGCTVVIARAASRTSHRPVDGDNAVFTHERHSWICSDRAKLAFGKTCGKASESKSIRTESLAVRALDYLLLRGICVNGLFQYDDVLPGDALSARFTLSSFARIFPEEQLWKCQKHENSK